MERGGLGMVAASAPVEIFCSYAHQDEVWLRKLEAHLSLLKRQKLISLWHNRLITPGTDWTHTIDMHLETASIILLLVSADFIASDYCYGIEMQRALKRQQLGQVCVIPLLVRPVDRKKAPFAHLYALPTNALPISMWEDEDMALTDVVAGIRRVLEGRPLLAVSTPHTPWPASSNIPYPHNPIFPYNKPNKKNRVWLIVAAMLVLATILIVFSTLVVEGIPVIFQHYFPTYSSTSDPGYQVTTSSTQGQLNPLPTQGQSNPSPTPISPQSGKVLYHANATTWSSGMKGWIGSADWTTANGMLVNDGTVSSNYPSIGSMIIAPYIPTTADYAVEAQIQFVGTSQETFTTGFGLVGRNGGGQQGYTTWTHPDSTFYPGFIALSRIPNVPFSSGQSNTQGYKMDNKSHTYRLELKGNEETFLFDGHKFFDIEDGSSPLPGQIGLVSSGCQINVSDFTVTAL